MDNKHVKLSVIGFAILLIGLVSVSYAFFNYTRIGEANTVRTGRIYFNASHGQALNITNAFPMTSTEAGNASLDTVTLGILGDTTYADGEEFEITIVDVSNIINNKEVPMNYIATYTAASGGNIGTNDGEDYWEDREGKNANIYTLTSSGEVSEGKQVLAGYIKSGATGVNGTLSISAYIDADRIAISDTYNGPESTPSANNGTTSEWVNGRTVFTTSEWNSISSNPISFKIKAESNEGVWVRAPFKFYYGIHGTAAYLGDTITNEYISTHYLKETPEETIGTYWSDDVFDGLYSYYLKYKVVDQVIQEVSIGIIITEDLASVVDGLTPGKYEIVYDDTGGKYESNVDTIKAAFGYSSYPGRCNEFENEYDFNFVCSLDDYNLVLSARNSGDIDVNNSSNYCEASYNDQQDVYYSYCGSG